MNNLENAEHYFNKLLNKEITIHSKINLSSAQQARAYGWLLSNKYLFDESLLSVSFSLSDLLNDAGLSDTARPDNSGPISKTSQINYREDCENIGSVGIDIQKISELFSDEMLVDPKNSNELTEIFTLRELSYGQTKNNPKETLAGIFAAKEAIQKAGSLGTPLNQIEILPSANGAPYSSTHVVSISHSGDFAIAVAISKNFNPLVKFTESGNICEDQNSSTKICQKKNYSPQKIIYKVFFILFCIILLIIFYKSNLI